MMNNAIIVRKVEAKRELEFLKRKQIYDTSRKIVSHDSISVELPIKGEGREMENKTIIAQNAPLKRGGGIRDLLLERGFSEKEIKNIPMSWDIIGGIALVQFSEECTIREDVGECLIEFQGIETVFARRGISGVQRKPDIEFIAGIRNTKTVHKEWGIKYRVDLAEVMFSPGNRGERKNMGDMVNKEELVLDMFAGIGYFSIPMAMAGAEVIAVEKNAAAVTYLKENAHLNRVDKNLYPVENDCRKFIKSWTDTNGEMFDRIVMGHYDSKDFLRGAYSVARKGSVIHLHEVRADSNPFQSYDEIEIVAREMGKVVDIEESRRIKGYSPGTSHFVIDIKIVG
tara:strand:- start:3003 stop:4025 length:1023 start_codon:yes stop_codon:yes gene_type:complete